MYKLSKKIGGEYVDQYVTSVQLEEIAGKLKAQREGVTTDNETKTRAKRGVTGPSDTKAGIADKDADKPPAQKRVRRVGPAKAKKRAKKGGR